MKEKINEKIEYEGEFISSYFAWISLDDQKEITNKLENITKDKKNKRFFL